LGLYFLPAPGTGLAICKAALLKKSARKKQAIAVLFRISVRMGSNLVLETTYPLVFLGVMILRCGLDGA